MKQPSMSGQLLSKLLVTFALTVLAATQAVAQFSSGIEGTVTDSTGAAVPAAGVVLINDGTQVTQRTTASDTGFFRFTQLPPGSYRIEVSHPGFKTWVQENAILQEAMSAQSIRLWPWASRLRK